MKETTALIAKTVDLQTHVYQDFLIFSDRIIRPLNI